MTNIFTFTISNYFQCKCLKLPNQKIQSSWINVKNKYAGTSNKNLSQRFSQETKRVIICLYILHIYSIYIYIYIHTHTHTYKLSVFQHWAGEIKWLVGHRSLSQFSPSQPSGEAWLWEWRRVVTVGVAFLVTSHPTPLHPESRSSETPQDPCVVVLAFKRL